jgi:hypothetical protein
MTSRAERDEILFGVVSQVSSRINVVNFDFAERPADSDEVDQ